MKKILHTFFFISIASFLGWSFLMVSLPILFIKKMEKKYSISLTGQKSFSFLSPKVKIKHAAFIWDQKVRFIDGDLEVSVDALKWLGFHVWAMDLIADGAQLSFVGDWLKKTGVRDVTATRLRVDVDFSAEGLSDVRHVELIAPQYQFQIKSRLKTHS